MLAATFLGVSLAVTPVADDKGIWGFDGFRFQKIQKMAGEKEWPFTASKGTMVCIMMGVQPTVYFIPDEEEGGEDLSRAFLISENVMMMSMVNMGMTGILLPYDNFEQLIMRISPYVETGRKLCKQPVGTLLPETEL